MKALTYKQWLMLWLIDKFMEERGGRSPSLSDLEDLLGRSRNAVASHLCLLEKKGYVYRRHGDYALQLTTSARELLAESEGYAMLIALGRLS